MSLIFIFVLLIIFRDLIDYLSVYHPVPYALV
jgi:hypothetical protein